MKDGNNMEKKVLFVVTNTNSLDKVHKTGLWLEEFAVPYLALNTAGYDITVASPLGGTIPIDPNSTKEKIPTDWDAPTKTLKQTVKLSQVDYKQYIAIIVPGGHGPLFDLSSNPCLAKILEYFNSHNLIIGTICHGAAGLISAKTAEGKPLVAGRKITGFTNKEEKIVELDKIVPFALETKLKELGANYTSEAPWSSYVVIDDNLITGQNPQSSQEFANIIIKSLKK